MLYNIKYEISNNSNDRTHFFWAIGKAFKWTGIHLHPFSFSLLQNVTEIFLKEQVTKNNGGRITYKWAFSLEWPKTDSGGKTNTDC